MPSPSAATAHPRCNPSPCATRRLAFYDEPSGLSLVAPKANFRVFHGGNERQGIARWGSADRAQHGPRHRRVHDPAAQGPGDGRGCDQRARSACARVGRQHVRRRARHVGMVVDLSASFSLQGVTAAQRGFRDRRKRHDRCSRPGTRAAAGSLVPGGRPLRWALSSHSSRRRHFRRRPGLGASDRAWANSPMTRRMR